MNGDTVMPLDYAALRKRLCELETMPGDDDWYEKVCELLAEALRKAADAGDADLPFRQWFRKGIMMLSRDPDLNESNAFMVWRYKSKAYGLAGRFIKLAEGLRYWSEQLLSKKAPAACVNEYIDLIREYFGTAQGFELKQRCFGLLFRPCTLTFGVGSYSYKSDVILSLAGQKAGADMPVRAEVQKCEGAVCAASSPPESLDVASGKCDVEVRKAALRGKEPNEAERRRVEVFGRFRISRYDDKIVVVDEHNEKTYSILRPGGDAAKAILTLIHDYSAGNSQLHDSSRKWKGAMQSGRGDAARFKEDQIFMLPKWSVENQRYLNRQYCGKWRLWTDDEMKLPVDERIENHKKKFSKGYPWQ